MARAAVPLLQPTTHGFAYDKLHKGNKFPAVSILCAQAAYVRSIEFRQLTWANVLMPGDIRLTHEPFGSAAFVVHSPKNYKGKPQIRVFNNTYVIAMLQILVDEQAVRRIHAPAETPAYLS